ncbi:MAG: hypothetical protein A2Y76_05055 [Planctomycetes bacterium RBG_13_60_9]|nr:MAG: hypothetical protein A2Y76_05055 [Planctomycetes bacterium RBG_13_60_9]
MTEDRARKTAHGRQRMDGSGSPSSALCPLPSVLRLLSSVLCSLSSVLLAGCAGSSGYSNASLFPRDVSSVYLEMFDNRSFRRGIEFTLTDALAKRIEAQTPYKIVSNRDRADSVMSGQIMAAGESILSIERELGRALEKEAVLTAVVSWKNMKDGRLMINSQTVTATAGFSDFQGQDFTYASSVAANKLAQNIVQLMENQW